MTTDAIRFSKGIQTTIDRIEGQRSEALLVAQQENSDRKSGKESFKEVWGNWLAGFGGWAEFLQIIVLIFSCLYSRYVYIEDMEDPEDIKPGIGFQNRYNTQSAINNHQVENYDKTRTIIKGFAAAYENAESPVITSIEPVTTSVITELSQDIESLLKLKMQRIQKYLAKWISPDGGTSQTIVANLQEDWKAIDQLCEQGEIGQDLYNKLRALKKRTEDTLSKKRPPKSRR